jgi:hypothetical protein
MKHRRHTLWLLSIAFVLAVTLPAVLPAPVNTSTPRINYSSSVCGDFADTVEPPRTWIPVGCESVLCCPGCPDVGLDWKIRVPGEPLENVLLQFDNLSPAAVRKLRINGKARWEGSALRYRELKEYERTHPQVKVPGSEEQYIASYMDNYAALYRVRAATALGTIGGADARRALEEASRVAVRKDVREAVKASLKKMK